MSDSKSFGLVSMLLFSHRELNYRDHEPQKVGKRRTQQSKLLSQDIFNLVHSVSIPLLDLLSCKFLTSIPSLIQILIHFHHLSTAQLTFSLSAAATSFSHQNQVGHCLSPFLTRVPLLCTLSIFKFISLLSLSAVKYNSPPLREPSP